MLLMSNQFKVWLGVLSLKRDYRIEESIIMDGDFLKEQFFC